MSKPIRLAPPPRDAPPIHQHLPKSKSTRSRNILKSLKSKDLTIKTELPSKDVIIKTEPPSFAPSPVEPKQNDPSEMRTPLSSPRSPTSPHSDARALSPRSTSSTKATTRSKKILVVDPQTQQKYPLNTDDHSLTNKELHVFHHGLLNPSREEATISGHTLSTASALTDAEHYGGKMYGSCHLAGCALEGREEESVVRGGVEERDVGASLGALSPLAALSQSLRSMDLPSPLSAMQSFFPCAESTVKCKRVALVIFPHQLGGPGCRSGSGDGTLMGMRFKQSSVDFMAHVSYVGRGSLAEKMGVETGYVVTFAISLSNMTTYEPQANLLAEKLIKRLESVGMRTSYRELFDIFLSKTTNDRPVGMVFRRFHEKPWGGGVVSPVSPKSLSPRSIPIPDAELRITDEFDWSTDFLRHMSIKCREYMFERCIPFKVVEKDAAVLSFLPCPNSFSVSTSDRDGRAFSGPEAQLSSLLDLAEKYSCASPLNHCGSGQVVERNRSTMKEISGSERPFLSNRVLGSLMEQAVGLVFVRRCVEVKYVGGGEGNPSEKRASSTGSGFVVVRKTEGEWSAPCFLEVLGSKSPVDDTAESSFESVHMIIINKKELAGKLILGNSVKFNVSKKQQRVNVLVRDAAIIANNEGRFELMEEFFACVKVDIEQNQAYYSVMTPMMTISPKDVLVGTLSPPEQSVDFYGALQSLELPYSMHAHPVLPEMIQPYCTSDWSAFVPNSREKSSNTSTSSVSGGGMNTILRLVAKGDSAEDKQEIDVFARRFQYYLMDGVPVYMLQSTKLAATEEKILRLTIIEGAAFSQALLEISRKRRPGIINVGIQGNYVAKMETITKLTRSPPPELDMDDEEKRRFFSFETDLSSGPVMMLAKSKKDSMLLLCGLKLLLEREKIQF